MSKKIVIIPAYKPSDEMVNFVNEIVKYYDSIVIIDDGSGEEYSHIFKKLSSYDECTILKHNVNMGKGHALKTAFDYCIGNKIYHHIDGVVTVDADGQHKLEDIISVCKAMDENNGKIVLGCRRFDDSDIPLRSRFGNKVSCIVYRILLGIKLSDTQTGLRGLPSSFLGIACSIDGERYEYETNMLIEANQMGFEFVEVPITTVYENGNQSSHFNPILDSVKIYAMIIRYSLSSILSVIIDYLLFGLLSILGISIFTATYSSRLIAAIVNFTLNRKLVFKSDETMWKQAMKYLLLLFLSGTISAIGISYFTEKFPINKITVKVIIESLLYFINYYVQKYYVFRKRQ